MYNLDELQKTTIIIKNGYIKLPDFFKGDEKNYTFVNINNQFRLYNENEYSIIYNTLMEEINKIKDISKREQAKRHYLSYNSYTINIPKNKIIKLPTFINIESESLYIVGNENHLRFFKDELEYQKYYEENNNNAKRIH